MNPVIMQLNNFTILRLVLATFVIFGHFKTLANLPNDYGLYGYADIAVDAFFVVSGYLVYGSFDKLPKFTSFYLKRFFRIYPLYTFIIFVQAAAMFLLLKGDATLKEILRYLSGNLIFLNFISPDMGGLFANSYNDAINPSLWTLKIEVAFYILTPFIWWAVGKKGFVVLAAIYVLSALFYTVSYNYGHESLAKQFPGQMRLFIIGCALYYYRDKLVVPKILSWFLVAGLFMLCIMRYELFPKTIVWFIDPFIIGGFVFVFALRLPALNLRYDISYGVYLIHAPLIQIALLLGFYESNLMFLSALVVVVYVLAYFTEKFIELPMIAHGKKLSQRFA